MAENLGGLKLSQLLQRARVSGAPQETLDQLMDADDPRASVLALLERTPPTPGSALESVGMELQQKFISESGSPEQVVTENAVQSQSQTAEEEAVPPADGHSIPSPGRYATPQEISVEVETAGHEVSRLETQPLVQREGLGAHKPAECEPPRQIGEVISATAEPPQENYIIINRGRVMACADDACGIGQIGDLRSLVDENGRSYRAVIEDRGVRGVALSCRSDGELAKQIELPLAFANIERDNSTLTITVHKDVHPDSKYKGEPVNFVCPGGGLEAETWQREMEHAVQTGNEKHWGVSKSFIREQFDKWDAERTRCEGMLVKDYFQGIGLQHVYDETWQWCSGALADLEATEVKTTADLKEIAYCSRKAGMYTHIVGKYTYEDMELTDYMNCLKHRYLAPADKQVSYADFIAAETDSSGRRKVARATMFVSHVWKMSVKEFFEVCLAEMGEDDYAWIDLYLHNQYQGAVSAIGEENSQYWVTKFSELIGGIGNVLAIVTDWENPVMLTRIWCLFELNAAIDTGAQLKFAASAKEKLGLSLQLNEKFKNLDAIISNIEVRNCDAKRPHEVQDKAVFLAKLAGIEDDVNDKLRKAMERWLVDSASLVLQRSDPQRAPMGPAELQIEIADIGEGSYCQPGGPTGAKATQLLEHYPSLPRLIWIVIMVGWICLSHAAAALSLKPEADSAERSDGTGSIDGDGSGSGISDDISAYSSNHDFDLFVELCFVTGALWLITYFLISIVISPSRLDRHQTERHLRPPPVCHRWSHRRLALAVAVLLPDLGLSLVLWYLVPVFGGGYLIWRFVMAATVAALVSGCISSSRSVGVEQARLAVNVGWLRMKMGEVESAEQVFRAAHDELQRTLGPNEPESYIAAPGLVRSLCDRDPPMRDLIAEAAKLVADVNQAAIVRHEKQWQHGHILRARMAAAYRSPDAEVLTLLSEGWQAAKQKRDSKYTMGTIVVSTENPEFLELVKRMSPDGDGTAEDRASWQALHPMMRVAGRNPASPWVKYMRGDRCYYQRDAMTSLEDPSMDDVLPFLQRSGETCCGAHPIRNTTLLEPTEGVRYEVEAGLENMNDGQQVAMRLTYETMTEGHWEYEYARLGGPGCWNSRQMRRYKNKRIAKTACKWGLPVCAVATLIAARAATTDWCNGWAGEHCQLAPSYIIAGAMNGSFDGRYERHDATLCSDMPIYQLHGNDGVHLFQPASNYSHWLVGTGLFRQEFANCSYFDGTGTHTHIKAGGSCPMAPDGAGCVGQWEESINRTWRSVPTLTVTPDA